MVNSLGARTTIATALGAALFAACGNGNTNQCSSNADCATGWVCCAAAGNSCTSRSSCAAASCQRPVIPTSFPDTKVLLHSTYKVGDTPTFTVPPGTGAVSILQQSKVSTLQVQVKGTTYENSAVPLNIIGPSGQTIFDINTNTQGLPDGGVPPNAVDPTTVYAFFGGDQASTATFTVPNTTASLNAGVPAGGWKMTVSDYAYQCTLQQCTSGAANTGTYDVTVLARPQPAPAEAANLDVNVYIVANKQNSSTALFTAQGAPSDSAVVRFASSYQSILKGAGITANVTFRDVSDADRARFSTGINADLTGPCDELDQMFLLSGSNPGNSVNLFLVTTINSGSSTGGGGIVVGIDGSIPGPATLNGTVRSGAVVSSANLFAGSIACSGPLNLGGCGADEVAYIAAHETGHFLGLFHTTEMEGSDFDPIADTGKCPCLPCASASRQSACAARTGAMVFPFNCASAQGACPGGAGDNLMFWQFDPAYSKGLLTPQQGAIMRLNPAVHP